MVSHHCSNVRFPVTGKVKDLFMRLLTTQVTSAVNCLSISTVHFSIGFNISSSICRNTSRIPGVNLLSVKYISL